MKPEEHPNYHPNFGKIKFAEVIKNFDDCFEAEKCIGTPPLHFHPGDKFIDVVRIYPCSREQYDQKEKEYYRRRSEAARTTLKFFIPLFKYQAIIVDYFKTRIGQDRDEDLFIRNIIYIWHENMKGYVHNTNFERALPSALAADFAANEEMWLRIIDILKKLNHIDVIKELLKFAPRKLQSKTPIDFPADSTKIVVAALSQNEPQFKLNRKLGSGAQATVYEDTYDNKKVAVKHFHFTQSPDKSIEAAGDLAETEHRFIQKCGPKFVVTAITFFKKPPTLIMELVEKSSLDVVLKNEKLSLTNQIHIAIGIAGAICTLQNKNVYHRDIKPANILLTKFYEVRLTDFAFASETNEEDPKQKTVCVGSSTYMAPERLTDKKVNAACAEIFSFGMTFLEIIMGTEQFQPLFSADLDTKIVTREINGVRQPLILKTIENLDCIPMIKELLHGCLQHDPSKRINIVDVIRRLIPISKAIEKSAVTPSEAHVVGL